MWALVGACVLVSAGGSRAAVIGLLGCDIVPVDECHVLKYCGGIFDRMSVYVLYHVGVLLLCVPGRVIACYVVVWCFVALCGVG